MKIAVLYPEIFRHKIRQKAFVVDKFRKPLFCKVSNLLQNVKLVFKGDIDIVRDILSPADSFNIDILAVFAYFLDIPADISAVFFI